jgi:hypothetical protein
MKRSFNLLKETLDPARVPWLGIAFGLILTAFLWLGDSEQIYTRLRWISYTGIIAVGLYLLVHNSRRRAFSLLTLFASVSIIYLFPALLGPGCDGMPRAFAVQCERRWDCADNECCHGGECLSNNDPRCGGGGPSVQPPVISSTISCIMGSNGWCVGKAQLALIASDPQGYAVTISGNIDKLPIACNGSCIVNIPKGLGIATFTVTAATSGLTASGSVPWKYDPDPPVIGITAAGDQAQDGWFSTAVDLSATALDVISGMAGSVSMSFDNGVTWVTGSRTLYDGRYDVMFRALDQAGNIATSQMSLKIDMQPPYITLSEAGRLGQNGWYVSSATVFAEVSDNLSGVTSTQFRFAGGAWQAGDFVTVEEGVHIIEFQAFDAAGNKAQISSQEIHVDHTPPAYNFDAALNGSVLADTVTLGGTASDETSGVSGVEFSPDGSTWFAASIAGPRWSIAWNSAVFDNGDRDLYLRAADLAGNLGEPIRVQVILDNFPPYVKLAKTWNIWESGSLVVRKNVIPLQSVRIVVHDPMQRYADQVIYNSLPGPKAVTWDRVIGPAIAPPDSYTVSVKVCDIYGLCSNDTGTILIPVVPTPVPLVQTPVVEIPELIPPIPFLQTPAPEQPIAVPAAVLPIQAEVQAVPFPIWIIFVIGGLLLLFAFLLLSDPRPSAIRSLTRSLYQNIIDSPNP